MQENDGRSARPKPPVWLRALEAVGLLAMIIGLASDRWWLAGLGFATVPLSYRLYHGPRGIAPSDKAAEGTVMGYDINDVDGGGGD